MLVPRRVRRRLLLPPGWVALGFLLLLGCQALRPWASQLKPICVMQLTMVPLKLKPKDVKAFGKLYAIPYGTLAQLESFRPWHTTQFKGEELADFLNTTATEAAIRNIIADTSHAGGVRVRFLAGATYANLVRVLDILTYTDQKKYWLDIRHEPPTLYAFTNRPLPADSAPMLVCGYVAGTPQPIKPAFQQLLVKVEQEISSLKNQAWRLPILLLVAISSWSLWQLFHRLLNYRNF